ncbi:hypothetical protein DXG03_001301 [Asterophora parasitica]|uniref:Fungal-type protein kinase domain-containing protein n=1 Tax=Asterophora parasitica TaxID=117018 RepID=A0A9P7K7J9_9AGAR|nr:hypothetical protein DXG03_001301 [Asterophora parasitica]
MTAGAKTVTDSSFGDPPKDGFKWPQILFCNEFKRAQLTIPWEFDGFLTTDRKSFLTEAEQKKANAAVDREYPPDYPDKKAAEETGATPQGTEGRPLKRRKGVIQSQAINFIHDLPRFLVLLLVFQRFELNDWGVMTDVNYAAQQAHSEVDIIKKKAVGTQKRLDLVSKHALKFTFKPELKDPTIEIDLNNYLSPKPHCLAGRATTVVRARRDKDVLAFKIYNPEVRRQNEGHTLEHIYAIVDKENKEMKKHLPEMLGYADIPGSSTRRIRTVLSLESPLSQDWRGYRITRYIVFKELQALPLSKELLKGVPPGKAFLKDWLGVVKCTYCTWNLDKALAD